MNVSKHAHSPGLYRKTEATRDSDGREARRKPDRNRDGDMVAHDAVYEPATRLSVNALSPNDTVS